MHPGGRRTPAARMIRVRTRATPPGTTPPQPGFEGMRIFNVTNPRISV